MRCVIQKVCRARVTVAGETVGEIGKGYVALIGVSTEDTPEDVRYRAEKVPTLRIFEDEAGKMNRSLLDVGGSVLLVSQFTLYANCRHGRRPDFLNAAKPDVAEAEYLRFAEDLRAKGIHVETGVFGADMQVESVNDGPVTIILDSAEL
jgi:D-tyrosyl-tRNA(Tyr) deacylase